MLKQRLLALIEAFGDRRVLVVGDIIADEFIYGKISRVSREAPVLILKYDATEMVAGGAGNAASNVAALGGRARLAGLVGRDAEGRRLLTGLPRGVERSHVVRARQYRTPVKTRILAGGVHSAKQQVVRIDRDTAWPLSDAVSRAFAAKVSSALSHCDAIVLLGDVQDQPRLLRDLKDSLVPVVALWQGSTSALGVPTIDVDNQAGVRAAVDHVAGLGHERIAFVSGRPLGDIREREAAFIEMMTELFGGVRDGYLQHVSNTPAGGATAVEVLLRLAEPPTAIVASTDTLAFGVLHAAHALGRRVPDDLSVVGFDDILLASHTVPALTTLRMPARAIVGEGLDIAIELSRNPGHPPERTVRVIPPELIVRQSTAPPPG